MSNSWISDVGSIDDGPDQAVVVESQESDDEVEEVKEVEDTKDVENVEEVENGTNVGDVENVENVEKESLSQSESDEASETDEEEDQEVPEISPMSVEEMASNGDEGIAEETTDDSPSLTTESITPEGALSVEDMVQRERRWKVLVWGPPGLFKSHFCYTMPEPIAYVDLENKAQDIVHKFRKKEIYFWQPTNFREAQEDLAEALDYLEAVRDETGQVGTIVVDSMALSWEWAKTAYKKEAYPMKDENDVTLSSNMGSSQESDWQHIKGMHNSEFRQWMTDSQFHFCWTAGEKEDYASVMSGESDSKTTPMKAEGEKNNEHKADSIIRAREDENGNKIGDLVKSNFTASKFKSLQRPTFEKMRDVIEGIEEAESSQKGVKKSELESDFDVEIVRGKPK